LVDVEQFTVPRNLVEGAARTGNDEMQAWIATLPSLVAEFGRRWSLQLGEPFEPGGVAAWVAPALDAGGRDVVLKIGWPHFESEHEADGLREWNGQGAARVYATDIVDETTALLIERCVPGTTLTTLPETEQDTVIAGLLRRLWREPSAGHPFRSLGFMCDTWADGYERKEAAGAAKLDPGLAREGIELFRTLPSNAPRTVLLVTDLHAGNVLHAEREPWLVIDPKPFVGDPTYDALQHLLNSHDRLHADPLGLVRRIAGLLELDAERLALWLFARCVEESPHWPGLAEIARRVAPS
jgi:streptomycin 6-kinase